MNADALLDSNVLIAIVAEAHEHHAASLALLTADKRAASARLYDRLIGEAAIVRDIPALVTWNVGHMRNLFPAVAILTPKEFMRHPPSGS